MNTDRKIILILIYLWLGAPFIRAEKSSQSVGQKVATCEWRTGYAEALRTADREGKNVLLNFTGSDWCIWCHRLDAEVLTQPAFVEYSAHSLILVEVDFPRQKPLGPELLKQNMELGVRYGIDGYPTIILVDATGKELGRTGYIEGGAKTFVRTLKHFTLPSQPVKS